MDVYFLITDEDFKTLKPIVFNFTFKIVLACSSCSLRTISGTNRVNSKNASSHLCIMSGLYLIDSMLLSHFSCRSMFKRSLYHSLLLQLLYLPLSWSYMSLSHGCSNIRITSKITIVPSFVSMIRKKSGPSFDESILVDINTLSGS